jgi:hypothetical protein
MWNNTLHGFSLGLDLQIFGRIIYLFIHGLLYFSTLGSILHLSSIEFLMVNQWYRDGWIDLGKISMVRLHKILDSWQWWLHHILD